MAYIDENDENYRFEVEREEKYLYPETDDGAGDHVRRVKITERGWPGHFVCADRCRFTRNTLLECGETRIVVSTVGNLLHNGRVIRVADGRYYETMAFHAKLDEGYWDANVYLQVEVPASLECSVPSFDVESDMAANEMHDEIVAYFAKRLAGGDEL